MRKLRYYFVLVVLILATGLYSQIEPEWPILERMNFTVNPAMAGGKDQTAMQLMHGRMWSRITSSPSQSGLAYSTPVGNRRMGIGGQLFSESVGPIKKAGFTAAYAYRFSPGSAGRDRLSLGMGMRFQHIRIDKGHFIAGEQQDPVIGLLEGNAWALPSFSVGFKYQTAAPTVSDPVQLMLAASATRLVPIGERLMTARLDERQYYYGLLGMVISASSQVQIEPSLMWSMVVSGNQQLGLRLRGTYANYGWLMVQFVRSSFFTTQLGMPLDFTGPGTLELALTYSWYFGTISKQLGNGYTFGVAYLWDQ